MLPCCSIGILLNKISQYFNTITVIRGLFIALLSSAFIYLNHWGLSYQILNTILGLSALFLLLQSDKNTWFWVGIFIGLFWFWWITMSLQHYGYAWGLPLGVLFISLVYGFIFWAIAKLALFISSFVRPEEEDHSLALLTELTLKALGLISLSMIHPFDFDWFKPELMFVESYLGIVKWQFFIILGAIVLSLWKKQLRYLLLILLSYQPTVLYPYTPPHDIALISTYTNVKDKWNTALHDAQFDAIYKTIDQAIDANKSLIILPESVFPVFINRSQKVTDALKERAKDISIVTGGLFWDGKTPRNSTYIFTDGKITVANKVLLVPFGESNPLPDFLSDWINEVFYDGAIDYVASSEIIDYQIRDHTYRNAICFEATSEKLYTKDKQGHYPKQMIVLSNNGWFMPSIEPTLQKLLLQYYSKKYGTTIYHAVNMSESYIIQNGKKLDIP